MHTIWKDSSGKDTAYRMQNSQSFQASIGNIPMDPLLQRVQKALYEPPLFLLKELGLMFR